jgi:gliding motility associated protien GldN
MKFFLQFSSLFFALLVAQAVNAQQSPQGGGTEKTTGRGDIYTRKNMEQRFPLKYHHLEEKDIFWEKRVWRVIDVREKINNPFGYPKQPFINILMEAAISREIPIYAPDDDIKPERFVDTMPVADLQTKISRVDSFPILDDWGNQALDAFGNPMYKIVTNELNPEDIQRYRLEEVWFFDEENSRMGVRIVGIAPMLQVTNNQTGAVLGEGPIFWIYYPEARDLLAKNRAFNPFSDVDVMSWEDIFEMRLFSSYIMKESNVYDRRIQDYKTGLDILYESENIHMSIFNLEQESWKH